MRLGFRFWASSRGVYKLKFIVLQAALLVVFCTPCFAQEWPGTGVYSDQYADKNASGLVTLYYECRPPENMRMSCLLTTTTLLKSHKEGQSQTEQNKCSLFSTTELSHFVFSADVKTQNAAWVSTVNIDEPCKVVFVKRFEKQEQWKFFEKAEVLNPESTYSEKQFLCKDFVSSDVNEYTKQGQAHFEFGCSSITVNKEAP